MSLRRNTAWNLVGLGLPLLLGVLSIPYILRYAGVERVGILTLVWALIGYFSLFDLGLGRALTQQVSAIRLTAKKDQIPVIVKTGLLFTLGAGLVGGVVMAALSNALGYHWLGVSADLRQSAAQAFLIASIGIPLATLTTGLRGVLEGYEEFRLINLLRLLLGIANFGLPVVSLSIFGNSIEWMVASLVVARVVVLVFHYLLLATKVPAGWLQAKFSKQELRRLFSFGLWITVSNVISPLMSSADRFIISGIMSASVVAYYSVPSEMLSRVLIVPAALTGALFPRISALIVSRPTEAWPMYKKSVLTVAVVLVPVCLAIALGSHWGLQLWLGKDFADNSWLVASILAAGVLCNGLAQVPYAVIQAAGNSRLTAILHLIELVLYVPILVAGLMLYGVAGAAIAWVIRVALDLLVLQHYARESLRPNTVVMA